MQRLRTAFLPCAFALISANLTLSSTAPAAESQPPASAVIPRGGSPAAFPAGEQTTATVASPAPKMEYREAAPGLLERLEYTTGAGPLAVAFDDILVAPGKTVQIQANQFAALLSIEAGAPQVSVDGNPATIKPGQLLAIDQGQSLTIDNRGDQRGVVARLIKVEAQGK